MSDTALRQNRMATAASVRHLNSFQVQAPVFGLVWAKGRVVAHVDWWAHDRVLSARWSEEWNLEKQEDILRVFLLVRNIDKWTQTVFRDKVIRGVGDLLKSVKKGGSYQPWRRMEDAGLSSLDNDKENRDPPSQPSSKPKKKTVVVRK